MSREIINGDSKSSTSHSSTNESIRWRHTKAISTFISFLPLHITQLALNSSSGVRRKLCALSLTARAQHGELPLPMPTILRRPTHMILVTGMTPNGLNMPDSSHDEFLSPQRSNGSDGNQCGVHRLSSNRRFNGSSGSGVNPLSRNGLGTEEENRNLMAETRFARSGPRTPR